MTRRILAIMAIYICSTVAWVILGTTVFVRSQEAKGSLGHKVASNWGQPHIQEPPWAGYQEVVTEPGDKDHPPRTREVERRLPLEASRIAVDLGLEHRRKGLLWFSTYTVAFSGEFTFGNPTEQAREVTFFLPFPAHQAVYDGLEITRNGEPLCWTTSAKGAAAKGFLAKGERAVFKAAYRSQGLDSWRYEFGGAVAEVRDFQLTMNTNFAAIDFPPDSLSPTAKIPRAGGYRLEWRYKNLISGLAVAMVMPEKLQPGPLAGRICFFAPVSLLFFFFLMFIITTLRRIELHPMNYFFLAAAFFSFHLLLAYLADLVSIHAAFAASSVVSLFLVISYLRLVTGLRFAAVEAGLTQFLYLVLFSYAFFFKGFTGLAVTIGAILTLFVVMQITGRIRWADRFAPQQKP